MRYEQGEVVVTGNPTLAWIEKMNRLGMNFTAKDGKVIAYIEGRK
jgi:hypothetical protein